MTKGQLQFINGKLQARIEELEENRGVYGKDCAFTGSCSKDCAENVKLSIRIDILEREITKGEDKAIELREEIEGLEHRLEQLEWIKVEDRLPERHGSQLYSLPVSVFNNNAENREVWTTKMCLPFDGTEPEWCDRMGTPHPSHITHWRKITLPEKE